VTKPARPPSARAGTAGLRLLVLDHGEVLPRGAVVGHDPERGLELGLGLGRTSQPVQDAAEVHAGDHVVRGAAHRALEMGDRLLQPARLREGAGQVVLGLGRVGLDAHRFPVEATSAAH